ncbi:hypothetical protein BK126_26215 [Paenibacillus sp. FSL H7-0326]|uniref:SprT-like domain-containing protein n=1 Tax=Paenibacillus sp. FSL H7-0326 TaxID=1921144 RepID=UPI00096BE51E|nr:SprT-like domain-containing protein [Paenibacillus sp. FSL H7-0326]OMC63691.1 hypothetical protein BK126_26215 [Paenibacillus sp. FSL H7-0326]
MGKIDDEVSIYRPIKELYKAFRILNTELFNGELTEPAILIQYQGNRSRNIYGWCTEKKIWISQDKAIKKYEINITAEYLVRGLTEIIHTLIHEMVHLYCSENGIQDTSRGGSYHNKKFKAYAERVGLTVEFNKSYGWSQTSLTPLRKSWIESLDLDPEAFVLNRYSWGDEDEDEDKEQDDKPKKPKPVWCCPTCQDPKIKSKKKLNIICGDCMEKFIEIEEE